MVQNLLLLIKIVIKNMFQLYAIVLHELCHALAVYMVNHLGYLISDIFCKECKKKNQYECSDFMEVLLMCSSYK